METKEIMDAIDLASKGLKEGVEGAKSQAEKALADAKEAIEQMETKADKSALENVIADLKAAKDELQDQHNKLSTKVNSGSVTDQKKTFFSELSKALESNKEAIASLYEANTGSKVNIKAATDTVVTTAVSPETAGAHPFSLTSFDNQVDGAPRRPTFMRQLVRTIPTSKMFIAWAEKTIEGGAAWTAEAAKKNQMSIKYQERSAKVEKVTAFVKASKESLADIAYLQADINTELREAIEQELDDALLNGTGVSPVIQGILGIIPTFTAPSTLAASVPSANRFDVIVAAYAQVVSENFIPNTVLVNPLDLASMQTTKDANGNYILPPFQSANADTISGMRVVANNGVDAGTFVVGDFSKATLAIREEFNIQIGYENDDFTKNLVTILAEMRVASYIKNHQRGAFVKGSFATAIAALEPAA